MYLKNTLAMTLISIVTSMANAAPPSHCKADEFQVLSAWMGKTYPTEAGWRNARNGRFLSLCADQAAEPFSRLIYRYGTTDQIEMAVTATPKAKFYIDSRSTSPHTGEDIVFFKKGKFTYYIAIATAQGSGVSLHVYEGDRQIGNHFSGNENNEDFQLGPAAIDFDTQRSMSPIIQWSTARHDF